MPEKQVVDFQIVFTGVVFVLLDVINDAGQAIVRVQAQHERRAAPRHALASGAIARGISAGEPPNLLTGGPNFGPEFFC